MKQIRRFSTACVVLCLFGSAWAAEVSVSPGSGTLSDAITAASDGDTLVLEDGGYYGAVTVDRSLTIRPVNRSTNAVVDGPVTIEGAGITVTLQGLKFSGDVSLRQAAAIRLLENEWLSDDIEGNYYRSSEGDGSLVVVGNRFGVGSSIHNVRVDGAYIAGNTLYDGQIETESYAWIVGNDVSISTSLGAAAIYASDTAGTTFVLGNRVRCSWNQSYYQSGCLQTNSAFNLIAGNIVEHEDRSSSTSDVQRGIHASGVAEAIIVNNVVRWTSAVTTTPGSGIAVVSGSARVSGNIVLDWLGAASPSIIDVDPLAGTATHNLCWNNSGPCPTGDGNIDADPQFVDLVDYALGPASPAIDAGPTDFNLADLDRSRNDMGVQGGPWNIGQYDAQRDPGSFAPYVYPLLKIDSLLSGGVLEYRTLGVARLR